MTRAHLIFGTLLATWLVLGASLFIPQHKHPRGSNHPTHKAMDRGGPGIHKHKQLIWFGWAFGSLLCVLFVGVLMLGIRRERLRFLLAPTVAGAVVYLLGFGWMMLSYRDFTREPTVTFFGSLPEPTTLMFLSVGVIPVSFVVLYVVEYPRAFWSREDERRFEELLSTHRSSDEEKA